MRTEDLTDVTLLLLKCKYKDQLFLKVGWFVTHVYTDPELIANPPEQLILEKVIKKIILFINFFQMQRVISVDDCRVTKYAIKWNDIEENEVNKNLENEDMNEENSETEGSQKKTQESQVYNLDDLENMQENIDMRVKELQNISVSKVESSEHMSQESALVSS